jgi:hypothetical protein
MGMLDFEPKMIASSRAPQHIHPHFYNGPKGPY